LVLEDFRLVGVLEGKVLERLVRMLLRFLVLWLYELLLVALEL
jgi:hypothetical protein